jgi:ParB family transcriptional regulator, chromosome partitioning protein
MAVETRKGGRGLGRGLEALIPTAATGVSTADVRSVRIDSVIAHVDQPRRAFDQDELQALADSIAAHGVLQPVIVVESPGGYTIVAGERRLRAAAMAGLETIPAIVRDANEQEQREVALVENIQRADLNAIEEARAYQHLIDAFGLTQERVAERVGRSRPTVANALRILATAPEVQAAVSQGVISGGHARALAGSPSHAQQVALLATIEARSLSVRQTEALVASAQRAVPREARSSVDPPDPDVQRMEARMRDALGTKVTIHPGRKGGRITIAWYDDEDLARLVDRLTAPEA